MFTASPFILCQRMRVPWVLFLLLPCTSPAVELASANCFSGLDPKFMESEECKHLSTLILTRARIWVSPISKQYSGSPGACRVAEPQNIICSKLMLLKQAEELCLSVQGIKNSFQGTRDMHWPKRYHICNKVWWSSHSVAEKAALPAGPLSTSLPLQLRYIPIQCLDSHALSRKKCNCFPRGKPWRTVWPQKPNFVGADPQAVKIQRNSSVIVCPWRYGAHSYSLS